MGRTADFCKFGNNILKIMFMITIIDLLVMLLLRKTTSVELTIVNIVRTYIDLLTLAIFMIVMVHVVSIYRKIAVYSKDCAYGLVLAMSLYLFSVFVETLENMGVALTHNFPWSLVNDVSISISLIYFIYFTYNILLPVCDVIKRKLVQSPLILIPIVLVVSSSIPVLSIAYLSNELGFLTNDLYAVTDTVINVVSLFILVEILSRVYNLSLRHGAIDISENLSSLILLVIGYFVVDAIDNFILGRELLVILSATQLFLMAILVYILAYTIVSISNLIPIVMPIILGMKTGIPNNALLEVSFESPSDAYFKIFHFMKDYMRKYGKKERDLLVIIGRHDPLTILNLKRVFEAIDVVIIGLSEKTKFEKISGKDFDGIKVLEQYTVYTAPTYLVAAIKQVVDEYYEERDIYLLFLTFSDIVYLMGNTPAYMLLRKIIHEKEITSNINSLFPVIVKGAHTTDIVCMIKSIIPRIIEL